MEKLEADNAALNEDEREWRERLKRKMNMNRHKLDIQLIEGKTLLFY